ncbi:MAG: KpsF/GutQ family sugar-phosphate isomerase [Rikenellaceae bacterium]
MVNVSSSAISEFAKYIVNTEIKALEGILDYIDNDFIEVVNAILKGEGRVIITGIGKSAIIGTKIVATLNSTGTPSIFMHAADAIHGDLGIIQSGDIVICISKSGNTPEIKVLIPLIRNLGKSNVIVGMAGNKESFLAIHSDFLLNTTVEKEACPMNLAPTSSTTAQLVMGDALSMTLLKMRGFGAEDFAKVHPGGALGKRLYIRVSDLVNSESIATVSSNASIDEAIIEISSRRMGATAVMGDDGEILGVITDGDLRRMLERKVDISTLKARDIMSLNPKTVNNDQLAVQAFAKMEQYKVTQLLVVDQNSKYCGIIHIHDILREGVV